MMNKEHRLILEKERDMLSKVKLDDLSPFLRKYKMFNKYMWNDIKTTKAMLDELPHRGPTAFRNIIEVLKKAKYYEEANQLESHTLAKKVDKNLYYILSTIPLGYCLIINNAKFESKSETGAEAQATLQNRPGSDVDATSLYSILKTIGFDVTVVGNKTASQMYDRLEEVSRQNFSNVHSLMIIILSHGGELDNKDFIYGTDGNYIFKSDIWNIFNSKKCAQLQNKPKVFFFICCRGSHLDYGVPVYIPNESIDSEDIVPTLKDMLVVHSTLPKQVSVSDDEKGSYFCQEFIMILKEHYRTHDLQTMINLVNTKLEKKVSRMYHNIQLAHAEALGGTKKFMFCKTCS